MLLILASLGSLNVWATMALPNKVPVPADNPMTPQKIGLGKMLFFDPRLSTDGKVSCNSCHNVMSQNSDELPAGVAIHGQRDGRIPPTLWNSAFYSVQFWDGRAASLEEQAIGPVVEKIREIPKYIEAFKKAFPKDKEPLSSTNVTRAIATYQRTLITPKAPFDKYMKGNKKVLSAQQISGWNLVQEIGCTSCHAGEIFAGEGFKMGEGNFQPFPQIPGSKYDKMYDITADLGRYEVTKKDEDKNRWRVPTWRNVAVTAPYFHNGKVKTLDEAVRVMGKTQLGADLKDSQVADIVAFLNSLTGEFPKQTMPVLP